MNNIVELLQRYLESTSNNQHLKEFLESCLENGVFYIRENAETIIKFINTNINSSFEREKGLLLLLVFLQQIPVEVFSNNALSWMLHCNKFLFQSCGVIDGLSIKALTRLIKLSVKFPEINKETAKQIIPKFLLDNVKRKTNIQVSVELLDCLHVCMSEYPGPSGEFKGDILKLLLRTVETKPVIVGVAARCVPLIARIGGGGKQGVSHKTSWQQQQFSLVSLLHSLLNKIYEHIDCLLISESMSECEVLKLEPVKEKNVLLRTQRLATQFTSVAHFLQAMLLDEFPVAKLVAPNAILDVITHAQKPTHASLSTSIEAQAVLSVLPTIQMAALRLLESLVLCLGRNTVPYGSQVCYLCSQVIIWTHQQNTDWPYAMDKPFSNTRLAAYCCLLSWLSVVGAASHLDMLMEKVLPIMLADIHVEKPTVRLRIGSKLSKGKRKQQMVFSEEDHSEKLGNCVANRRLCEKSVQTLALVVRTSVSTLKPETYKNITDTVLKLTAELPIPYSDANCHCALYQLLLTLCLQTHPFVAPPLAPAIAIFTSGLHHFNPQVKATCTSALSSLGRMIRPIAPTLYFPIPQENPKLPSRESSVENNTADDTDTKSKKRKMDLTDGDSDMSENSDSRSNITFLPVQEEPQPLSKVNLNSEVSDSPNGIVELSPVVSKPKINDVGIGTQNEDEDLESINTKMEEDNAINIENDKNSILLKENDKLSIFKENSNKVEETGKGSDTTSKEKITVIPDNNLHNLTNSVDLKNEVLPEQKDPDVVEMLMDFQDEVDSGNEI